MNIHKIYLYPIIKIENFFIQLGEYSTLMIKTLRSLSSFNIYIEYTLDQMLKIGVQSIPIVILTSLSGCAKDYNPWTTIVNQLIKANYGTNNIQ